MDALAEEEQAPESLVEGLDKTSTRYTYTQYRLLCLLLRVYIHGTKVLQAGPRSAIGRAPDS